MTVNVADCWRKTVPYVGTTSREGTFTELGPCPFYDSQHLHLNYSFLLCVDAKPNLSPVSIQTQSLAFVNENRNKRKRLRFLRFSFTQHTQTGLEDKKTNMAAKR